MASSVPSYVNFQSSGTSSHLTRYSDYSFLTVWTDIDRDGNAYVYGKAFNADGTVRKDTFLIDSLSSGHSYTDITVTTLIGGETVIAWGKRKGSESDIALSLLDKQLNKVGNVVTLREIEAEDALEQTSPQIYALADGGFGISYKAKYDPDTGEDPYLAFMHTVFSPQGDDLVLTRSDAVLRDSGDASIATAVLSNGFDGLAFVGTNGKVYAMAYDPNGAERNPIELGSSSGLLPLSITPLAGGGFVTVWEETGTIRAQVINSNREKGASYSFSKPAGVLVDPPVIAQLEGGGFAVAFRVDVGNEDDNVYTAAVAANGSVITNTTHVGTNTAGDQWDPSLTSLNDNNYAVSWRSDGGQLFVEVVGITGNGGTGGLGEPPPGSSTTWTGTAGDDVRIGSDLSETFSGLGGRDSIRAGGGNDTVDGGIGNDRIWGGTGNDVLMGRDGFDVFVFDTKPNKSTNKDTIVDFSSLFDSIWLENKVFTKLGKKGSEKSPAMIKKSMFALEKAKDKDDYIIYSKKKATISYDADGSGTKYKAVEFATVKKGATVTYTDFYVI